MFRTIGIIVVCLCLIGGVGYYLNWFSFSETKTDNKGIEIHGKINTPKIQTDLKKVEEKASDEIHHLFGEKTIVGTIQKIDSASEELTIRDKKDKDVTVKLETGTKIKIMDKAGTLSDLKAEDSVSVTYEAKKDGNVAKTVTVSKKS